MSAAKAGHDSPPSSWPVARQNPGFAGDTGEFTVWSEGDLIYSKKETGRFPEDQEVLAKLA